MTNRLVFVVAATKNCFKALKVAYADVAQLVAHHLAKVRVASSSLVIRSTLKQYPGLVSGLGLLF